MIKRIEIQNYRSCLYTTLDLNPELSVLIGPNSSGKTNILNALLILQKLAQERQQFRVLEQESTSKCKLKVWFNIEGKEAILTISANIYTDEDNHDNIVSSNQQWYVKDFTGNGKRIKTPLWLLRDITRAEKKEDIYRYALANRYQYMQNKVFQIPPSMLLPFAQITKALSGMSYYSATQFTNPSLCPVSFEIEKGGRTTRSIRDSIHTRFLLDLYYSKTSSDNKSYNQFFEIIGPKGIKLVDSIEFKEMQTSSIDISVRSGGGIRQQRRERILVIPQIHVGKNTLSPNQLSEGTFKTMTLLFYLITGTSEILLIEEPEVCVHHGLLSSIIELIKIYSDSKQIIFSTHSDFVLDEVQPDNVYKVKNIPDYGTKVSHMTKSMSSGELKALHNYLETEGNLGEYWRLGGIES